MRQEVQVHTGNEPIQPQVIAVLIGQLGMGGSERQLYMFLAHCDRSRWAPIVYVAGKLGCWEAPIQKLGIPVVLLRGSRFAKLWQFRADCVARDVKCCFSWSSYTNGFGLTLIGRGVRRIGSFRNALFAELTPDLARLWSWWSLACISTIVCNSRETQAQLWDRNGSAKRIVYVPNGVHVVSPECARSWREKWRARLGLRDGAVLVLGVGRLAPQKNFSRFIDVIAQVRRKFPAHAAIAGPDFGCLADLEAQLARLGLQETVSLMGPVHDARELQCAADILLLSSDWEGMPNVILEAMAASVPCVTTKVGGVSDLIEHGASGFIAEPDVDDLARYVVRLAADADMRHAMGARAQATIERAHQSEQIARQLWTLCE